VLLADVSVDLSCPQTRVSKKFLHDAQVGTAIKEVGRETVAQRV
jgi:hypothetical protein